MDASFLFPAVVRARMRSIIGVEPDHLLVLVEVQERGHVLDARIQGAASAEHGIVGDDGVLRDLHVAALPEDVLIVAALAERQDTAANAAAEVLGVLVELGLVEDVDLEGRDGAGGDTVESNGVVEG